MIYCLRRQICMVKPYRREWLLKTKHWGQGHRMTDGPLGNLAGLGAVLCRWVAGSPWLILQPWPITHRCITTYPACIKCFIVKLKKTVINKLLKFFNLSWIYNTCKLDKLCFSRVKQIGSWLNESLPPALDSGCWRGGLLALQPLSQPALHTGVWELTAGYGRGLGWAPPASLC